MNIVIDLSSIYNFFSLPPDQMLWQLFWTIGWIPTSIVMLWGIFDMWVLYRQDVWGSKQKFIILAIDIPKGNSQSPKAVENLFTYIAGAHSTLNLIDEYWEGKYQLNFSFEIASIEGYTQFLVRGPEQSRNLMESAIYSQYPDAEITEVNDYTTGVPTQYPDDEYDVWGAEFIMARNTAYPIKTYKEFEHQMGEPETHFRDPMASLMDLCSTLGPGEQLWYQLILWPIGFDWPKIADAEVAKILKEKPKAKVTLINKLIDGVMDFFDQLTGLGMNTPAEVKKEEAIKMIDLKPQQKRQVEGLHEKVSKLGFKFKIRMVYVAKKDVMNKPKVVNGFVGYMKQFVYNDLNNLKPDMDVTATSANYLFKDMRLKERKSKIVRYYMGRSSKGRDRGYMNVEELASIWHFPIESVVRAPMIQKAPGRKAEPPMSLPVGEIIAPEEQVDSIFANIKEEDIFGTKPAKAQAPAAPKAEDKPASEEIGDAPPDNLPFV